MRQSEVARREIEAAFIFRNIGQTRGASAIPSPHHPIPPEHFPREGGLALDAHRAHRSEDQVNRRAAPMGASHMKRIKVILPVPLPPFALENFSRQIPEGFLNPDIVTEFVAPRAGASILDSYYEMTLADAFCLEAGARAEEEGFAAVCLNSMSDSGLAALRSRLRIPVVGPGQASYALATTLGRKFSILSMWKQWDPLYKKALREQGLEIHLASIRNIDVRPDGEQLLAGKEDIVFEKLRQAALRAIEDDGADVLILGSTTMYQSHAYLSRILPVPVINPGLVALKLCEALLALSLSHSKVCYRSPESLNDSLLSSVPQVKFS
jgi:allantoin racemase